MSICIKKELTHLLESVGEMAEDTTGGITRLLYSEEWLRSQELLKSQMEKYGLTTYFDDIGNLYGRLEAAQSTDVTVLTGSHVDTVRNGGKYDGMYGVAAGMMALRQLKEQYGAPKYNLEVVSFAEEEGSRFPTVFWGSKNMLGIADIEEATTIKDPDGHYLQEEMRARGFDFPKDSKKCKNIKSFIELHIEQGNVLELEQKKIGVVNSIAGQRRYAIEVHGTANHAGTTPMQYRHDALHGVCKMVAWVLDRAKTIGAPLVATTGFMEVIPNIVNVIPGAVKFSMDIRHTDSETLKLFTHEAEQKMREIAESAGLTISIDRWMDETPVPMDENLVKCVESVCEQMGTDFRVMHSGAGHDAQVIAKQGVPCAMIFVPSKEGISHNPAEHTEPDDLAEGLKVLIETLHKLAY